ncbi:putative glycosyltransferase EpsJ [Pelotomaculum sp. FP]|uniref:glycosyltransferase n=1 Tax=Pelotomaculum sp. FP TaxID=261474 RepID=UPI0010661715|nr:glycosyltransferase [Pelotomaculum sp. FP]TEB16173.1 putative glycosyltransferase EpsJ [Pelotomaculum sp. FP]
MEFDFNLRPGGILLKRNLINEGTPLVTIVTPFYNAGRYLMETANSVFNQTFPYFEWIIVDDGSTNQDDIELLDNLIEHDSRVKIYHKENGGPSSARNYAISKSSTDIIISLDADDLIDPTYLECTYFALLTNKQAGWCYADSIGFGSLNYLWKKPFNTKQLKEENFLVEVAAMRKAALISVGFYDESETHAYEDWHLWLKFLRSNYIPVHLGYYGSWYRRVDSGVFRLVNKDHQKHTSAMRLINEVAMDVDDNLVAIEYPCQDRNHFAKPFKWEWNRKPVLGNEKCKVLMILPWLTMGGADTFNLDVVSRIDKKKFEVSIITTVAGDSAWRQKFEQYATDIFDLTTFLHMKNWSAFIHYFIKSRDVDVIFVSNSYYGYYLVPWLRKEFPNLPILDYVHMEEWYWRAGGYARTTGAMGDVLDRTYVCSNHLKNVLVNEFGRRPEDIEVVYINVDENEFSPDKAVRGLIRTEAGVAADDPVVLFPCRIHPQKRPFLMLEIAKELCLYIENIRFFVVGDGPELDELKLKAHKDGVTGSVFFFGQRQDMVSFYRDSDLTLICSIKEGLALTTYESLSMGVPVVSSDVGGQRELIDKAVGITVPLCQNEEADFNSKTYNKDEVILYVNAIREILSNKDRHKLMSNNCRQKILGAFSKKSMIKKLEDEFVKFKVGEGEERRSQVAGAICMLPNLIDDYQTIYCEYTRKDWEAEQNWAARCYFYEQLLSANHQIKSSVNKLRSSGLWKRLSAAKRIIKRIARQ